METFDFAYFDRGIDRVGTDCEKWDFLRLREGADVLPMWVADMDFPSPPAVSEALARRAQHATYGYTEPVDADFTSVIDFWQRHHGLTLAKEEITLLPCVVTGLRMGVRTMTQPGDGVIIQPPVYGPFFASIRDNGRQIVENPLLHSGDRWEMDFDGLENCLRGGAKLLLLCNPHNPVGRAWDVDELTRVVELCARYGAKIVCDEIHADFVFTPKRHVPILSIPGAEHVAISLAAASKTFNVAGLKQAVMFAKDEAMRAAIVQEMTACGVVSGNQFALVGTRACYLHGDAWLAGLKEYLKASREIVYDFIRERLPHIGVSELEATYLMWLDCRSLGVSGEELRRRTIKGAGVALTDGTFFGAQGEGFLRLNIGCPHAQLREALVRLEKALKKD